ncbi:hypothetical protein [Embleya sp. MST-111070]|uniref:hypothetical protein n=1 Tax=Embleya sp. MST-111070 TaxID=3398231 RepID=UPI003F73389F
MDATAIVELLDTPEARANPYPLYEQAHRLGPVARVSDTLVLVTGYAAVDRVLRDRDFGVVDPELNATMFGYHPEPPSLELFGRSILQANQPAHTRMRATAMLARLEATVAFPRFLARFPASAQAPGAVRDDRLLLRGYGELPITVGG